MLVRRKRIAVISLLVLVFPSCGFWDDTRFGGLSPSPSPSTTATSASAEPTTSAAPSAAQASTVIDDVRIQVTAAPADKDLDLTVGPGDSAPAGIADADARVAATKAFRVELDGGATQPSAPVRLEFDLSDRPDFVAELGDSVVAVVESVSATDPSERDMFTGTWNPTTKTLTTEVPHLTDFWVSAFNVFTAIENGVGRAFELIRGDSSSPCRVKSELTIGDTQYVLTAGSPGAIAGCLVDVDGTVAIDFENATGSFYAIQVAPPQDIGGTWVVGQPLSMDDAAGSMVVGLVPNNKGVLAGRSSGRFTLNPGVTEGEIRMVPQPHGVLVKSLLAGVSMFGIDLKRFEHIPEAWDCFVNGVGVANIDAQVTTAELNAMIDGIAQCLIAAELAGTSDKSKQAALHRLSVAVTLLIELPRQLLDFVAGGLQEAAGDSVKHFGLRASTTEPEEAPPVEDEGEPVIDRIEVSTWGYDRIEGDTYVADNTNAKQLAVYWKSYAGDKQVRRTCTSTVRLDGPGTSKVEHLSSCDSYNPGTYLKAMAPGLHTVTVTVRQEGQPEIIVQRAVTILPHS